MRRIIQSTAFFLALCMCDAGIAATTSGSVRQILHSWAKTWRAKVVWEAGDAYDELSVEFPTVDPAHAPAPEPGISSMNRLLERTHFEPLKVCLYPDTVVIRRLSHQDCS